MIGGGLSLVSGLANQIIIAVIYGTGEVMNAFQTALVVHFYI